MSDMDDEDHKFVYLGHISNLSQNALHVPKHILGGLKFTWDNFLTLGNLW